ncbi:MAG: hypothetical protein GY755_02725 [Chloroflexi bacterium]|nr:hypothetical protein [Chloroflexota bacterium]
MILDYIENYEYVDDGSTQYYEAKMALARLADGMILLHREVMKLQQKVHRKALKENTTTDFTEQLFGNYPKGYLSCIFQWYAVSACSYGQLVGKLKTGDEQKAKAYVKTVMPRLRDYRNKVAAHMAFADPFKDDNPADLASSLFTQIIYHNERLCAGALTVDVQSVSVSKNLSWSLTEKHTQLSKRYWPHGNNSLYQALMIPPGTTTYTVHDPELYI